MIYFINFGMPSQKSGIEHAELKRLELFKRHRQLAKIIARDWNAELHRTANASGVDDRYLVGMFDVRTPKKLAHRVVKILNNGDLYAKLSQSSI